MSLRRAYRDARRKLRFHLAVLLTIVVVAYSLVPQVARLVESLGGYNPGHFEPKDLERGAWLRRLDDIEALGSISGETLLHIALFLLVAVVWLTLVPTRAPRRPPPR
ncbi:MAG TPA: hypothetical protein VFV05_21765 [Methylomirabilota bacterium]|nr:hypothetical protein [Methylomirabilota bacterium]